MTAAAKFKLNFRSGEIEIEGSEDFVKEQIEGLAELVSELGLRAKAAANESADEEDSREDRENSSGTKDEKDGLDGPTGTFGEWMHSFRSEVDDLDKALITARYVQAQSSQNDFKTSEVNKALKDHGIRLSNPSRSIARLAEKRLMFQTRKVGVLRFMRVSVDGQAHLNSLRRSIPSS